jgi:hypothetical protein
MSISSLTSTTRVRPVPKSVMLPTLSSMALTASCCPERRPRVHTLFRPVCFPKIYLLIMLMKWFIVLMMAETCFLAESAICYPPLYDELRNSQPRPTETAETVSMAAVASAAEQGASAILVLSTSGNTARLISKYRPNVPIITGPLFHVPFKFVELMAVS